MKTETAYEMAMKTWASWVENNVMSTKTSVFFRSISPEHKGKNWCYDEIEPISGESYVSYFPKSVVDITERILMEIKTPVRYLNITKLSQYRRDAHPTIYATRVGKHLIEKKEKKPESIADCSHWCLPGVPDTWNRLLYASMVFNASSWTSQAYSS